MLVGNMTLTASEVASITTKLFWWEISEYCFAGLVTIGCFGEYIAEFTDWLTNGIKERKDRLAKRSTLLLVTSLALELVCLVKTSVLSGQLIGSLNEQAKEASENAQQAIEKSGKAATTAQVAVESSERAVDKSNQAEGAASNAMGLARGARQEADTFEKRLGSAEHKADEAESHLAEALRRATEATAALDKIRLPRSLTNVPELVSALEAFKDTEYTFSSVFQDGESIALLRALDTALQSAGWKRVKPPHGFPAINVYGNEVNLAVTVGFNAGVQVSVDSSEPLTVLQSLPVEKLPQLVRAAVVLNNSLSSHISPQGNAEAKVDVQQGTSKTIRIAVGKKP